MTDDKKDQILEEGQQMNNAEGGGGPVEPVWMRGLINDPGETQPAKPVNAYEQARLDRERAAQAARDADANKGVSVQTDVKFDNPIKGSRRTNSVFGRGSQS